MKPVVLLEILLIALGPVAGRWLHKKGWLPDWISPVVFCYAVGIAAGNLPGVTINTEVASAAMQASLLLALPLLLFPTDLLGQIRSAGKPLLAFGLCAAAGILSTALVAWAFRHHLTDSWRLAGMLTGMYTGGTPNMQAIGIALGASENELIAVNAADIFGGGVYLVLLSSFLPRLLLKWLPAYRVAGVAEAAEIGDNPKFGARDVLFSAGLAVLVVAGSVGLCLLFTGKLEDIALIILCLTTLGLTLSFVPSVRNRPGSFETGEFLLLAFCVALGLQADFAALIETGQGIILFSCLALGGTIILHFLFCRGFGIDRDTCLIASTAGIYGPAFIGQVAAVIGNRRLVFNGIALGLLGYAVGNYLGISLGWLLKWWLIS
ncbi:MAG TPA: DUF819 family protein [Flavilitoribacter sp.]|nr:DUF819 family protein [Flavilitoribacter sp.]